MSSYIPRSLLDQYHAETADPSYRMSMLPFGTYPNADGSGEHLGLAVPGMIQEPMNALMRLMGTPSHPGTFTQGPDAGSNSEDMRTLLETFLGGNATRGMGETASLGTRALSDTTPSLPGAVVAGAERQPTLMDHLQSMYRTARYPGERSIFDGELPQMANAGTHVSVPSNTGGQAGFDYIRGDYTVSPENDLDALTRGEPTPEYYNALLRKRKIEDGTLFSDQLPSLPGAVVAGAERPGFDVWHGSPHDFDQFDLSKIGTGEGAQAYGHGLYFAENPAIAGSYKERLAGDFMPSLRVDPDVPDHIANIARDMQENGRYTSNSQIARGKRDISYPGPIDDELQKYIDAGKIGLDPHPGYLYQARINANPEDFLDWDKPLSEQPPSVTSALEPLRNDIWKEWQDANPSLGEPKHMGQVLAARGPQSAAALREAGIPGIKYLDAGSRTAGDGSRNYVVFDHNLVDTLHKWRGDQQLYSDQLPSLFGSVPQGQQKDRNSLFNF